MTITAVLPLLQSLKTKDNLSYFLEGAEYLISSTYKLTNNAEFHANVIAKLGHNTVTILEDICMKNGVNYDDMHSFVDVLKEIRVFVSKIPVFSIKITFSPTDKYLGTLYDKISKLCGDLIVIDVEVDPLIVAGCVISYKGRYINRTLYKDLDAFFENNKNYVLQYIQ